MYRQPLWRKGFHYRKEVFLRVKLVIWEKSSIVFVVDEIWAKLEFVEIKAVDEVRIERELVLLLFTFELFLDS